MRHRHPIAPPYPLAVNSKDDVVVEGGDNDDDGDNNKANRTRGKILI